MPRLRSSFASRLALGNGYGLMLVLALAAAAACSTGQNASPTTDAPDGSVPIQNQPFVYAAKVKNVLVGLPPTEDEVRTLQADPSKLAGLVDGWMKLPQYDRKMETFFELAFQQTQISIGDFIDQSFPRQAVINPATQGQVVQNARESFARTVLALNAEGRPFTETMTTQRFMMTPALMELYAFFDAWQVDDAGKVTDRFANASPGLKITIEAAKGPIPISETLDPASPNYMHWYDPDIATPPASDPASCTQDPIVYPADAGTLHFLLHGSLRARKSAAGDNCQQRGGSIKAVQLEATDFTAWKMVTIRPPKSGETPTAFHDLAKLRATSELVMTVPRVGFFSTPAFFANWQTNTSNQARVTTNQALIVALGSSVDGNDATVPPSMPGLDDTHAQDQCVYCHQTLDPTRSILASTYSWNYHKQTEGKFADQKGLFAFQGVTKQVGSVAELGTTLAEHPLFASAWVQKLCYYVNSSACSADDPEFKRIVEVFKSSKYSWNALVRELVSSPITTHVGPYGSATAHEVIAVARRDHLCAALDNRLGFTDVCALDATSKAAARTVVAQIVSGLPSDGYGRGSVAPVLPNEPSLFYRSGTENICTAVATEVIDNPKAQPNVKQWSSAQPEAAIAELVALVMALTPVDPRSKRANEILKAHFDAALKDGASPSDALKSTFVVACLAPSAVAIGL